MKFWLWVVLLFCSSNIGHALIIDTTTHEYDPYQIYAFGPGHSSWFAQSFNIKDSNENILKSLSLSLKQLTSEVVPFDLYITDWEYGSYDHGGQTKNILFSLGGLSTTQQGIWETFPVEFQGLRLEKNTDYAIVLDAHEYYGDCLGFGLVGTPLSTYPLTDWYVDGTFAWGSHNIAYSPKDVTLDMVSWTYNTRGRDIAFKLKLASPVPEPSTLLLLTFAFAWLLFLKKYIL